ncbi:MAG: hypothetical protein IJ217_04545 [Clostridia bacterium]|nr:hypothetical protein [Clostridia bacterium]
MTTRRLTLAALLMLVVALVSTSAFAGNCGSYVFSGEATFILDNSGKPIGIKSVSESVEQLGYQSSKVKYPKGIEANGIIRRKALAKVSLQDEEIVLGGTKLCVTVSIDPDKVELVEMAAGELSVQNIINATIYYRGLCDVNSLAGHRFIPSTMGRIPVGTVTFKNGQSVTLFAGDWDCDCELELGFAPGFIKYTTKESSECHWDDGKGCWITEGKDENGSYCYSIYIYEKVVKISGGYTTSSSSGNGKCK